MKQGKRDALLGLVFFTTLGLLLLATAVLGDWSLKPRQKIEVVFKDAQGLKLGDPVVVLGVRWGFARDVTFLAGNEEERVLVKLELIKPIEILEDVEIRIQESSLLGGKMVYINPGRGAPRTATGPIKGISRPSPLDALGELLGDETTKANVKKFIGGATSLVEKIDKGTGTLAALWNERGLYELLVTTVEDIGGVVAGVRRGEGSFGKFFRDDRVYENATSALAGIDQLVSGVNRGEGTAGKLFKDDRLYESLASAFKGADEVIARANRGEGTLGMLLTNRKLADDIAAFIGDLGEGKGLLGRLLRDERWSSEWERILMNFGTVTDKLASGEGSVGRLIMDDTLVRKLERLVGQFSRTLEDAREAAPIGTFFQVFGNAFY